MSDGESCLSYMLLGSYIGATGYADASPPVVAALVSLPPPRWRPSRESFFFDDGLDFLSELDSSRRFFDVLFFRFDLSLPALLPLRSLSFFVDAFLLRPLSPLVLPELSLRRLGVLVLSLEVLALNVLLEDDVFVVDGFDDLAVLLTLR